MLGMRDERATVQVPVSRSLCRGVRTCSLDEFQSRLRERQSHLAFVAHFFSHSQEAGIGVQTLSCCSARLWFAALATGIARSTTDLFHFGLLALGGGRGGSGGSGFLGRLGDGGRGGGDQDSEIQCNIALPRR